MAFAAPAVVGLLVLAACSSTTSSVTSTDSGTSAGGLTAYVTNSQDNGKTPGMGTVFPISLTDQMPGTAIEMGEGTGPNDIVITSDGKTGWVTNEYTNSVASIDLATGAVGKAITVGAEPVAISIVPQTNEQWAWVSNYQGQTVSTINLATGTVGQTIKVPYAGPNTVAFTPDGKTAYVANWGTGDVAGSTVTPIQVTEGGASGKVLPSINVGLNPNWIAITSDGSTAYVANKGSNSITPINVADNTAGAVIKVPGPPIEIEIAPNGEVAYVAIAGSKPQLDEVVPLNLTTTPATAGTAIKLVANSQPHWIAFTPDGVTAYVVGNGNSTVTPITVASGTPGTPIQVTTDPDADLLAIAITPSL
ncbi:MAG: YncE family protein [Actinomycetota bacterium]|nr:YncE family protein [Actinomycetota bacterium]